MSPGRTTLVLVWAGAAALLVAEDRPAATPSLTDRLGIKYTAPTTPGTSAPADLAPADKSIVVLPRLHVRDTRIPLTEDELFTPKGRVEEAKRRHLSPMYQKTFGPLSHLAAAYFNPLVLVFGRANEAEAMAFYDQEMQGVRARAEMELRDLGRLADDAARWEALKRGTDKQPPAGPEPTGK